jgi:transcriptional regulator with XRE-family HTH domain
VQFPAQLHQPARHDLGGPRVTLQAEVTQDGPDQAANRAGNLRMDLPPHVLAPALKMLLVKAQSRHRCSEPLHPVDGPFPQADLRPQLLKPSRCDGGDRPHLIQLGTADLLPLAGLTAQRHEQAQRVGDRGRFHTQAGQFGTGLALSEHAESARLMIPRGPAMQLARPGADEQELCVSMPSEVFRARLREVRRLKRWTQADLAAALVGAGMALGEPAITRMERGPRGVSLDEAIAIAAMLGVSPPHMVVPPEDSDTQLTPRLAVPAADARAWIRGQRPLREADERLFYVQTPPGEADWFPTVPGPWRFKNQQDFEDTRARWEREIFRAMAFGLGHLEQGPDAEDIPVHRPGGESPER